MKLEVTQRKSTIGCLKNQIRTMEALGLKRIRHTVVKEDNPAIRGMIKTVNHLVTVVEIED